jgi:hypothetical protein
MEKGRYVAPLGPGFSAEMLPEILPNYGFPEGLAWAGPHLARSTD